MENNNPEDININDILNSDDLIQDITSEDHPKIVDPKLELKVAMNRGTKDDIDEIIDTELVDIVESISIDSFKDLEEKEKNKIKSKSVQKNPPVPTQMVNALLPSTPLTPSSQRQIDDPTENDALYNSIKNDDPTISILREASLQIAEEVSWLKAWRKDNFDIDEDKTSDVSKKIMQALRDLIETTMDKEKILNSKSKDKIDFRGENFKNIFEHFLKIIQRTFERVNVPREYNDVFFSELAKSMNDFEKTAEKIYYGKKVPNP